MSGLIIEIQQAAMDHTRRIEDVLRMALAAASKLGVTDIQAWINRELNGYRGLPAEDIPQYRQMRGEVKGFNPYHGWRPVHIQNEKVYAKLSVAPVDSPISEIAECANRTDGGLTFELPPRTVREIQKAIGFDFDIKLHIPLTAAVSAVDGVRTRVLQWALDLEAKGILGEKMSFSSAEKDAAQSIHIANVENLSAGVIGQATGGAAITNAQTIGLSAEALGKISGLMMDMLTIAGQLPAGPADSMREDIAALRIELEAARRPGHIKQALTSMKGTLENAAGGMISAAASPGAQDLITRIAHFLGAY